MGKRLRWFSPPTEERIPLLKILFFLAIALGAALSFPRTREPILELVAPALDPLLSWQTRREMKEVARELESLDRQGQKLPEEGADFDGWLSRNFQGGSRLDGWGNAYSLLLLPDSAAVVSAGRDGRIGTPDDLVETVPLQRQRSRRR